MKRFGIFAGTFDPVHKGHIAFALQARQAANLEKVYFLPEISPRRKAGVSHIAHRVAMLKQALRPYPHLALLELPDKQFSVAKTWPRIQRKLSGGEQFLLLGADKELEHLATWPLVEELLTSSGLIIALRQAQRQTVEELIKSLPKRPQGLYVLESDYADISSAQLREAVRQHKKPDGLLASIAPYVDENWLYVDVSSSKSS